MSKGYRALGYGAFRLASGRDAKMLCMPDVRKTYGLLPSCLADERHFKTLPSELLTGVQEGVVDPSSIMLALELLIASSYLLVYGLGVQVADALPHAGVAADPFAVRLCWV